jgi:hypothetical protein
MGEPWRQPFNQRALDRRRAKSPPDRVPERPFLRRQMSNILRKQIDLDPGMSPIGSIVPSAPAGHSAVVRRQRHLRQHRGIDIGREYLVELQMVEGCTDGARRLH